MGRTANVPEQVENVLTSYCKANSASIGFIIGQLTDSKDYIIHLVRCLSASDKGSSNDSDSAASLDVKKKTDLSKINEKWIVRQAKQVTGMLPGGLSICGAFAVGPPDQLTAAQPAVTQLVFGIEKQKSKLFGGNWSRYFEQEVTDRYVLFMCSQSRKITLRTVDSSDVKSTLRPAEWRVQAQGLGTWGCVSTCLSLDHVQHVPSTRGQQDLAKQIQASLSSVSSVLDSAFLEIDGNIREDSEPLDVSASGGKKGKQRSAGTEVQRYNATVFEQRGGCETEWGDVPADSNAAVVKLSGHVSCVAFLHPRATVAQAKQALMKDAVCSLVQRTHLLIDDLLNVAEEEMDPDIASETPARVLLPLPGLPFSLSDHMFPDETVEEVATRASDLLDLIVNPQDVMVLETLPAPEEIVARGILQEKEEGREGGASSADAGVSKTIQGAVASFAVAALAAGLYYFGFD